jgi:16S rRNA (cytosine967-C5)-methyltransferase
MGNYPGMARPRTSPQPEVPGLAARRIAADILDGVLRRRIALDDLLSGKNAHPGLPTLADRDRALTRRLVATVLRRLGTLRHMVGGFLEKGFPSDAPRAETILLLGAAQILWLEVPDHAAVDLSVRLAQADRRAGRYAGLVNAVLRRVTQASPAQAGDVSRDTPQWLIERWSKTYGSKTARAIAAANGHEPALDLTVKSDADSWAERLRGADGNRAHIGPWRDFAAAGIFGRRLVGAGRRRRVAGATVGRCAGQDGRRFVCGTRRQNGAARACRRPGDRR